MNISRPLALTVRDDTVGLENGQLPVLLDMPGHWQRTVDSDGDLLLGYIADSAASCIDVSLGKISCTRWMACARNKLWWMTPEWGTTLEELPTETQFLLLEHEESSCYTILLPLLCGDFRATLKADRDQALKPVSRDTILRIDSGDVSVKGTAFPSVLLASSGTNIFSLLERAVAKAASLSGQARSRADKKLPESVDLFGWCTWDAFYSKVSAKGVQEGLQSLAEGGIRPGTLIIDDGWQMTAVDEEYAESYVTKALRTMKVSSVQSFQQMDEEFDEAGQAVLSSFAADTPGGSELMTQMPALYDAEYGDVLRKEMRDKEGSVDEDTFELVSSFDNFRKRTNLSFPDIERTVLKLAKRPKEVSLWARLVQRVAGWALGLAQVFVLIFYQVFVDPAGPNTWSVGFFKGVARGVLKAPMLSFFKISSDFTRRLISVKANGKFSSPDSGTSHKSWFSESDHFKTVVDDLRLRYGVQYVYCWHAISGYWGGVAPSSDEFSDLGTPRVVYPEPPAGVREIEPAMLWNPAVLAGVGVIDDAEVLYKRMHSYLSAAGIDGVKVDCQAGAGLVGSVTGGGPATARRFHEALEDSVAAHFPGNHMINCMCHSTENIYQMRDSNIIRASDDFYPLEASSSGPHIAACAYNSLFLSQICQPDWDMFQSKHPAARMHACARAVSGGAVYVSDKVGRHNFEVLKQLVLRDGSILRALRPGLPTSDTIFSDTLRDNLTPLKVWNENLFTGVVGAFNIQGSYWSRERRRFLNTPGTTTSLWVAVTPNDVETMPYIIERLGACGCAATGRYAVLQNETGDVDLVDTSRDAVRLCLQPGEAELFTIAPIVTLKGLSKSRKAGTNSVGGLSGVEFAVIGLANMMNAGGAVLRVTATKAKQSVTALPTVASDGSLPGSAAAGSPEASPTVSPRKRAGSLSGKNALEVEVRGEGTFVMFCTAKPSRVDVDGVHLEEHDEHGWKHEVMDEGTGTPGGKLMVDVGASALQNGVRHVVQVTFA